MIAPTIARPRPALFERETLLDAFARNPGLRWTPEGLSSWYGIRDDAVQALLDRFVEDGIVSGRRAGETGTC